MKVKLNTSMLIVTIQMNTSNNLKFTKRFIIIAGFTYTNYYGFKLLNFYNDYY